MRTSLRRTFAAVAAGLALTVATASPSLADATSDHTSGNAQRSVVMLVKNNTHCNFKLIKSDVQHGIWFDAPTSYFWSRDYRGDGTTWISTESNGFLTGTQGDVAFAVDVCDTLPIHRSGTWEFNWNNPYVGSNSYSSFGTIYPLKVTWSGGGGDNAVLTVTIDMAG